MPDVAAFPKDFAAALGEHFEFLGGEKARIECRVGTAAAERFWVAKVRAKTPGRYLFKYTVAFRYPAHVPANWNTPVDAEYYYRIAVGKAGDPRVIHPYQFGGSAFPHANAGDTLLIPIHADPFRVGHRFEPVKKVADDDPAFNVIGEDLSAYYRNRKADPPVVRNLAADRTRLLFSWVSSGGNRPGTATRHDLGVFLEFTAAGAFNLAGRLAAAKTDEPGVPFRVLPKDRPAAVMIEPVGYTEATPKYRSVSSSRIGTGTLEARVGDRVVIDCGGYGTPGLGGPDPTKTGVVEERPFRDVPPYAPR